MSKPGDGAPGHGCFLRRVGHGKCVVNDCPHPEHAKGYCRMHYLQVWRYGRIGRRRPVRAAEVLVEHTTDEVRAAERVLSQAQQMYEVVVGFEGKMRWASRIREARANLEALKSKRQEVVA